MPGRIALSALCLALVASPAHAEIDLWPLLEIDEDTTTIAYPFYVKDGDFMMVFPFYTRTNEARDHHVLWPLFKVSEGRVVRVAPFYFGGHEGEYTLFPLIRQTQDYTLWSLPPTYISKSSNLKLVFPFYLRADDVRLVFPNLYADTSGGRVNAIGSAGLFDYSRDGEVRSVYSLLWLVGNKWGGHTSRHYIVPFFWKESSPDASMLWLAPYHRSQSPDHTTTAVYPFYRQTETADATQFWLLPYYSEQGRDVLELISPT